MFSNSILKKSEKLMNTALQEKYLNLEETSKGKLKPP